MHPVSRLAAAMILVLALAPASDARVQAAAAPQDGAAAPAGDEPTIRFNFKGATFDQVVDFFSRATGMPVVRETDVPEGTLDFLSPVPYSLDEGLRVLNTILQARGVMLRVEADMLYLQKLTEMQKEAIPIFVGELPGDVPGNDIITVVRPLDIAMAAPLAEKLATMVAAYGSVTPMNEQNALVLTETAAVVRRLLQIIDEMDRPAPEDAVEIIPVKYANAADLMDPLKALLATRVEKYITDKQGQQIKVSEESMPGLNISFDERTNTIIARGVGSRIARLRETIALIDVPSVGAGRTVRTFTLVRLAPADAASKLTALFAELPEESRPTVLPLDEVGKVTLVGSHANLNEAAELLAEVDGGGAAAPGPDGHEREIALIALTHAEPDQVVAAVRSLLNGRQSVVTKMIPGPDDASLIIAGLAGDVAAVRALVPMIDRPAAVDRQVRVVRLGAPDPAAAMARARDLYDKQIEAGDPRWSIDFDLDAEARMLTMFGAPAALDRFAESLRLAESVAVVETESRQVALEHATPSALAPTLAALARQVLAPHDGRDYVPPVIEALDPLHSLVVTARPDQHATLQTLIRTLDRPGPGDVQFKAIALEGVDVQAVKDKADYVYERLAAGSNPRDWPPPAVEYDRASGALLVSGATEAVRAYEQALGEARRLVPPARTGRLLELASARAADVVEPLRDLLAATVPVDPARTVPPPDVELIERTNSLYVVAEPAQHELIARYVRQLDTYEARQLPPLQLLQVRAADAGNIASMLRERYSARPAEDRRLRPVEVDADAQTNTLIVTAHPEVFGEIRSFVDSVNRAGDAAERETMLFSLKRARADDLAQALDRLYPQPPMPLDYRGRPLPHLQKPKEIHVSADRATNTLIVEAPAERREQFEALVEQLDRVQLPPQAQLRTYHIDRGDPAQIARTLAELARQGVLSQPAPDGGKAVEVIVQAEPVSRTLIVAGDELTFEKTEQMLADLQAVPVPRMLRVFEVTGADPRTLADRARRLYEEQTADIPDAGEVSVEVDQENATILVVADSEAMIRFAGILDELRDTIGPPPDVRLVALEYADAAEAVTFLRDLVDGALAVGAPVGPPPLFEAIERTNSVLVAARGDQHQIIAALLEGIDKPEAKAMPPLRILQLRTADAGNLASALTEQYDRRHHEEREAKPVTITADQQTNALIVAAHPDMLPDIQAVVDDLNSADRLDVEGREIRIFPLRVARAQELARTIDEMFPPPPMPRDYRGRPLPHLQQPPEIVVRADAQTNALIVDAPIQRMAGFEKLVEQLDRQQIAEETEVRTYRIVNAELDAVARTLRELADGGNLAPTRDDRRAVTTITTEPVSRTIVVSGATEIFGRIEQVLAELDAPYGGPATTLRFFRLEHARAEAIAPMVKQVLERRITEDVADAGRDAGGLLNISADRKTNTLLISAPAEVMPVAEALVNELDNPRAAVDVVDVRIFALTHAKAPEVAGAVRQALEARARAAGEELEAVIAPEPSSNALVVTGTPAEMAQVEAIVASLDEASPVDQVQVRTVFLKHARAEQVAPLVSDLLGEEEMLDVNQMPWWVQVNLYQARLQSGAGPPEVRVAADTRLNAVVISAPAAVLGIAEQMVAQLDVDRSQLQGAGQRSVRVLVVENADAAGLAANLEAIFAEESGGGAAPSIRVDAASNSLIVLATAEQYQTIERITQNVDRATLATARQMRMIPVDPAVASAQELARTLQRMLERRARGAAGAGAVEVITLDELLERRKRSDGEDPPGPTSLLDTIVLSAFAMVGQTEEGSPAGPFDADDADLTIAVDPATNSLVVVGSPRAVERVADLTDQLLSQIPAPPGRVRYVGLPAAVDAATTAQLVTQTIAQLTPAGGAAGDLRRRVAVLADRTNNALIVACSDHDFETVGDLIAALSRPPTTERMIVKVYPLQTITADRAAGSVRQMLDPAAGGRRGRQAQRMRDLAVTLLQGDQRIEAVFDPDRVEVMADAQTNALVVMGPPESIEFVDQFIELLDQTPVNVRATLKLYPLEHARARELNDTFRLVFQARFYSMRNQLGPGSIVPEFAVDERTNTLLVTASPEQLAEVDALLDELDRKLGGDLYPLVSIELTAARPEDAAQILDKVVIGSDQARRSETMIVPDDTTGLLLVRAAPDVMTEIREVLGEVDRAPAGDFKVRTIVLERADASAVARIMQQLYDDRARIASTGRGRREQSRRVSVIGDPNSNTLLVAAADEDFEQIRDLAQQFDTPEGSQALSFKVFQLKHAKATEIEDTVQGLIEDLTWNQGPFFFWWGGSARGNQRNRSQGTLAVRADPRINALIATGEGDKFDVIESLIAVLDAPQPEGERRLVRLYRIKHIDVDMVGDMLLETFTQADRRRWWEPPDPTEIKVETDDDAQVIMVSGSAKQLDEIDELIATIDSEVAPEDQQVAVIPVEFADANELARTMTSFLRDRARARGGAEPTATIAASRSANTLVVSADADQLATIRDLLSRIDQPELTNDRTIEIVALQQGDADEIARIIKEQFGTRGGAGVVVTADVRTNSLIVNAPNEQFAQARALIERLDAPRASDETIIRTYALDAAKADDVVRILTENLQLDARGETKGITIKLEDSDAPAVEVKARVVADRRSNSLIVTGTEESFPVIETLIARLDEVPAASPVEYRIIPLEHALAIDVTLTLDRFVRGFDDGPQPRIDYNRLENQLIVAATADQFEQIARIVAELDKPSDKQRITDFVPLRFAEAEQIQEALSVFYGPFAIEADTPAKINTRIVADPVSNSLVITADESEWANIRALLAELDSEEYDSSLQLKVIPLVYADARSVAQAINEVFEAEVARGRGGNQPGRRQSQPVSGGGGGGGNGDGDRRDPEGPSVLVQAEEWVRASAEQQTNSIVVSASRQNIAKIEHIVAQLDVADYAKLPPPRLIAVRAGDPDSLAQSLRELYEHSGGDRGRGRTGLRIVGDRASNAIIVRAQPDDFEQIRALAEALQSEASSQGLTVQVITLEAAPASRVRAAIEDAFAAKARQANQPLAIREDRTGNSLVVAASGVLLAEIRQTVDQLDRLSPAAGQGIFIIELEHVSPEAARQVIETIGLHQPARDDSVSRLVTEPITITPLAGRNAVVVVANPADRETIIGLLKAIDHEPELAEAQVLVVSLRNAQAAAVAQILDRILSPGDQQADTALARAVQEQVRRLSVRRDTADAALRLDLTKPIRVIADTQLNALVISSTAANVQALRELALMFDELPLTDAVTVQLFPLQNIAADRFAAIVRDMFNQGKRLGSVPGADIDAVPEGMVGRALLGELALSVDERTNTVIVAGKEDAVALVEVLSKRIDTDVAAGWIEPRVVELVYADSTELAGTLNAVLVEGTGGGQPSPLQRQVARMRLARLDENGGHVLESELFAPMSRLLIRPEPKINALVVVGTPANLEIVLELIRMLDVEAAAPGALVRIYPVQHASASRLAATVARLFDQQVAAGVIQNDDRVIVSADERTNALVVSTSPRSFSVLEPLLETLDTPRAPEFGAIRRIQLANASVGRVADIVNQMMNDRLERLRLVEPETAELQRATIVPDLRTNSLVVGANPEAFEVIATIAEDLDRTTLAGDSLVSVIPVVRNNVERIAETVDAVMDRRYAEMPSELRDSQKPLVLTDPRSNSLLVAASPEDCRAIEDLVERLEGTPMNPAIGLHVIQLAGARAEMLAQRLQSLMQQRLQSLGEASTPSDRISIQADTASNSLIVAASEENIEVVRNLIDALHSADEGGEPGSGFEIIQLVSSRAGEMAGMLEDLYVAEANRRRGRDTVRVTADERLNALLVNAPQPDLAALKRLAIQLDGAKPSTIVEIKYIPLSSANALETVGLIESVLSGRGLGTRTTPRQATVVKYLREFAVGEKGAGQDPFDEIEVSAAVREAIQLTPDLRTNTVIVSAPAPAISMIERMIRDLDATSTGAQNIRIFKLKNADALAMAEILSDLFNLQLQGNLYVLKPREAGGAPDEQEGPPAPGEGTLRPSPFAGLMGTELTAVPDIRQALSLTVDSRTNSLLVSGTPTYLDLVEEVVIELDALEANEREVLVYPLRNAAALDVASVVSEFVDLEQQKLLSTLSIDQLGSAARLLEREITIVGDQQSNTVMVSASPRYMSRVREMIEELDVDPPQVLIQVLLAEITLDSTDEFGVDLQAKATIDTAEVVGDYGLGALGSAVINALGVPSLSVTTSDFDLLIRAISAQGRLQVLSNPSVMAANNKQARIQVGENIGRPSSTALTEGGVQQTDVEFIDIGVILEVTPSINPDGFVRMEITPEITDLTNRTTQVSEDLEVPILTKRVATTTVTVRDGQTIVIGGLISDQYEERVRKVPLLGDIPLMGWFFRTQLQVTNTTELLIVLTPHVITSPAEAQRVREVTDAEIDRLSLSDAEMAALRKSRLDRKSREFRLKADVREPDEKQDGDQPAPSIPDEDYAPLSETDGDGP